MSDLNPYEEGLAIDLAKAQASIKALEAKLAQAVLALRKIGKTYSADGSRLIHSDKQVINMVYIVLAEIEGDKS